MDSRKVLTEHDLKQVNNNLPLIHCLCISLHGIDLTLSSCFSLRMFNDDECLVPLHPHFTFVLFSPLVTR